jgi:hypothetical protein
MQACGRESRFPDGGSGLGIAGAPRPQREQDDEKAMMSDAVRARDLELAVRNGDPKKAAAAGAGFKAMCKKRAAGFIPADLFDQGFRLNKLDISSLIPIRNPHC